MKSHSSFSYLLSIAAAFFSFPVISHSQISEPEILSLLAENQIAVAQERVNAAYQRDPNSSLAAYYRALFEENAETATSSFQNVAKRFKSSEFAERALYRLGQYHFARGSYMRAREFFQELAANYPRSPLAVSGQYFAAKAAMISGQPAPAREELLTVLQSSPGTWMADFAREDLAKLGTTAPAAAEATRTAADKKTEEHPKSENQDARPENSRYAVQAGAFSEKSKAQDLEKRFRGSGYKTEVHERKDGARKYYLVWVGSFSQRDEAWKCADDLRKNYNVKSHVVRRDD